MTEPAGQPTGQQKKERFLTAFAETGIVVTACKKSKVPRSDVYFWQETDEDFGFAFDQAKAIAVEIMEAEADRRGVTGVLKPIYQSGRLVGHVREFSDTLLIFRLKALRPDIYRENRSLDLTSGGNPLDLASLVVAAAEDE